MGKELENQTMEIRHKHLNYLIPAKIVAKSRADYYALKVDGFEPGSKEWQEEYEYSFDSFELKDWYYNNMDFEEVKDFARPFENQEED
jgi:hypothetical protein